VIRFNQFSLARGAKSLFENTTFSLNPGEKAGLIGANGAGKSTLFALLRGFLHPDGGDFSLPPTWLVAHVAQETPPVERTAVDYTLDGDTVLRGIEAKIESASLAHDGDAEANGWAAYADADGYTALSRAEALLLGLGFTIEQTQQNVASFSGGWRMRLNLAQALMCRSDLLLLDEPTNHLDLDAIVWLEDWLRRYPGTLIVISHDREFLDAICNVTLHLENKQIKRYGGNYSQFEIQRGQQLALQQNAYDKQQRNISHLQSFVDRFKAQATKARQAQSRVKALEKMELIAPAHIASPFTFSFRTPASAPNPMMVMDRINCGYPAPEGSDAPAAIIVNGITLSITNGERIGLLGANGQGKSTLIKTLAGELIPLSGSVTPGRGLQIGYFAQHQVETLRSDDSPLLHLSRLAPDTREQELRDFLGSFNFRGDMATASIAPFSGGEKARLALALIIWQRPNLLLLDEPTNHLDLETRHALTMALAQFEGTLIVVSHDRHLLRATTDNFMLVANHKLQEFDGDLDDYRDWLLKHAAAQRAAAKADKSKPAGKAAEPAKVEAKVEPKFEVKIELVGGTNEGAKTKEQRRADAEVRQQAANQRKPLQNRIGKLEKEIATLEAEKAQLDATIADPASYEVEHKTRLIETIRRQGEVVAKLAATEVEWMMAQEELEAIA
jgi:ATP-binding cassette, subfamily F, member 3